MSERTGVIRGHDADCTCRDCQSAREQILRRVVPAEAAPSAPPAAAPLDLEAKALAALGEQHNADAAGYLLIARFAAEFAKAELARAEQELEQVKVERDGWKQAEQRREREWRTLSSCAN